MLAEALTTIEGGSTSLYYALVLKEWILVRESQGKSFKLDTKSALNLARSHYELWTRLGTQTDKYHLSRARDLFTSALREGSIHHSAHNLFMYCKVLHFLGEMDAAAVAVQKLLSMYEQDPDYPNYLFFAGGIYKALGEHEKANNYFFEASQLGPPKFFSKLEMMIIVSRTIEDQKADEDGGDDDDAYKMVRRKKWLGLELYYKFLLFFWMMVCIPYLLGPRAPDLGRNP